MILDEIITHKRAEVAARKTQIPLRELQDRAREASPARDFRAALRLGGISLIAEVKRASPSRGPILPGVNAVELAGIYEQAGARAISVLTDERFFGGTLAEIGRAHV